MSSSVITAHRHACETNGVVDEFLGRHLKWADFKRLSRHTMDMMRNELSAQAERDICAPTDWNVIEAPPKPRKITKKQRMLGIMPPPPLPDGVKALPPGIVNRSHMHMLSTCVKLRKGTHVYFSTLNGPPGLAHDVILKKMISEESAVLDHHVWEALGRDQGLQATLREFMPPAVCMPLLRDGAPEGSERLHVANLLEHISTHAPADAAVLEQLRRGHAHAVAKHARITEGKPTPAPTRWDIFHDYVARTRILAPVQRLLEARASYFHVVAQHVAYEMTKPEATDTERETPELKWLLALGMGRENWEEVTIWFYRYARWDQPDDRCATYRAMRFLFAMNRLVTACRIACRGPGGTTAAARRDQR